jgi:hypothetical protein
VSSPASAPTAADVAPVPGTLRRALGSDLAAAAGAGILAMVAAAIVLELWNASLRRPLGYGGDGLWLMQTVKAMLEHGWFLANPDVGAPFGQELYDFTGALGDNVHFLVIKAMSLISQDPVKLVNAYFLLSFFLCAFTACLVLRALGVSRGAAVVAAVLFSLLPAHVGGGVGRLTLGAYWTVPLAALLIMRVFAGEPLFARRPAGRRLNRWMSRRTLLTALMCVLIAGSGLYYALFTILLLALAALAVAVTRRDMRSLLGGALAALLIMAVFLAHISPSLRYTREHGANKAFSTRPVSDSSVYATSLTLLVSPVLEHRLQPAADFARRVEAGKFPAGANENALSSLGLLAALGFVGLMLVALVPGARRARERAGPAAATAFLAFALGTSGGIGLLVALLVTSSLRGWGRISPFIGFVGLFAVALAYDALRARAAGSGRVWRRRAVAALLPLLLALGVADQTTPNMVPDYEAIDREYVSDARFVDDIELRLPTDASVLQLPPAAFPESGAIATMPDYSLMRGPLLTDDLRFSYGSVKGRPEGRWVMRVSRMPLRDGLRHYAAAGFDGIWIDRRGYGDRAARLERALGTLLPGVKPLSSENDDLAFHSLVDYRRRWAAGRSPRQLAMARDSALHLTNISRGPGTGLAPATTVPQIHDPAAGGAMTFLNPGRLPRTVIARGLLQTPREGVVAAVAILPGGRRVRLRANRPGRPFELRLPPLAPGGRAQVRFVVPGARAPLVLSRLRALDASVVL